MGKKGKHKAANALEGGEASRSPKPERSADVMIRVVMGTHLDLSRMADQKAHIMIGICAAISAASVERLFDPPFRIAAMTLLGFDLLAILFAVLSTMPRLAAWEAASADDPNFNLLFFGHFAKLPYEEFATRFDALVHDQAEIHRSMARDLYSLGRVLADRKYRYLGLCYKTFLTGIVTSTLVLGATFLLD